MIVQVRLLTPTLTGPDGQPCEFEAGHGIHVDRASYGTQGPAVLDIDDALVNVCRAGVLIRGGEHQVPVPALVRIVAAPLHGAADGQR